MNYQNKVLFLIIAFISAVVVFTYIAYKFGADIKRDSVQMRIAFLALTPALMALSWFAQLKWWGMFLVVSVGWLAGLAYFKILIRIKKRIDEERGSH